MNDSMTAHQFKIKETNGWSTYCRTDDTLAADGVSHPDSQPPPATRGCHPPPEVLSPTFAPLHAAKPHLHLCTVSLPPHAPALTRCIPCQRVNLTTGQLVIRLANWPTGPLVNRSTSVWRRLRRALVNVSTCQPVPSRKRLSPCHLAHMSPRDLWSRSGKFWFSDPMVRPDPVFSCS